jgi:hypothetical protein
MAAWRYGKSTKVFPDGWNSSYRLDTASVTENIFREGGPKLVAQESDSFLFVEHYIGPNPVLLHSWSRLIRMKVL